MISLSHAMSYVVATKEGDPIIRPARARLIWAANTAEATSSLGLPSLLAGGVDAFEYRIENVAGKHSALRSLESLYGVRSDFDVFLLHRDGKAGGWTAEGDFARYVLPRAGVVHTRDPRIAQACAKRNIYYILENHDEDYQKEFTEWASLQMDSPVCLAIVAITEAVAHQLEELGFPKHKIIVLDSGVNETTARRRPKAASRWRSAMLGDFYTRLAVYTGGMQAERGISDILVAAQAMPETLFVMAGGHASDLSEWRRAIVHQGLGNVRLIGYQNHEVVCELQQAADVLIFSRAATGRPEITSPLKVFEYLLSGSPLVAASIPATQALKQKTIAVQLYEPGTPQSLVDALRCCMEIFPYKEEGYTNNVEVGLSYTWKERQRRLLNFVGEVRIKVTF